MSKQTELYLTDANGEHWHIQFERSELDCKNTTQKFAWAGHVEAARIPALLKMWVKAGAEIPADVQAAIIERFAA